MNSKIQNQSQNNKKFQLQTQNYDHYNNIKRIKLTNTIRPKHENPVFKMHIDMCNRESHENSRQNA